MRGTSPITSFPHVRARINLSQVGGGLGGTEFSRRWSNKDPLRYDACAGEHDGHIP